MTVKQMRDKIIKVYDNKTWRDKVYKMPNNQVIALYYTFLRQGKIK